MSKIVRVKNATANGLTVSGISIPAGAYYTIPDRDLAIWTSDDDVIALVGNGELVVNNGADNVGDIESPTEGWKWLLGDTTPISDLGDKLAVHSSSMPIIPGKTMYLSWSGAGDDVTNHVIGGGDLLGFSLEPGVSEVTKIIEFDPLFGDVYIHEAYAKWQNGGPGDYMSATIFAGATAMQTSVNLDYVLDGDYIKYAPGGAGTGTHGFGGTPVLIPRSFSVDGDWDYDNGSLTPNFSGTGRYKMSVVPKPVHRYINKMPLCFSSNGYTILTSDETALLPAGYYIEVTVHNVSDTTWSAAFMFETYRENTIN